MSRRGLTFLVGNILWYDLAMISLETPLVELYGVGDKVGQKLQTLGLHTVYDLLYYYPRRYEDFSEPRRLDQVTLGEHQIVKGKITEIKNDLSSRQRMKLTRAIISDETGQLALLWFNQPFLIRLLRPGTVWLFAGKVERDLADKVAMVAPVIEREGKIIPIYGETAGLSSKIIRKLLFQLKHLIVHIEDWLPESIRSQYELVSLADALTLIHYPESIDQIGQAKRRLAFDELFLLVLGIQTARQELATTRAPRCQQPIELIKTLIASLPFILTDSQRLSCWQIVKDLAKNQPMNRLLEGDVGSGKTVVGALAAAIVIKSGYQAVWLAPTEILANQHYRTCSQFLTAFGIKIGLLTGSTSAKLQGEINNYGLIIGTQALIQEKVKFDRLGLIIVDEQHRFGVSQRAKLVKKEGLVPHFLSMTATPIPRTLALTLYGDLDISQLHTLPTGRKPVITRFVDPGHRSEAYEFIRKQVKSGRQVYVVCPLVAMASLPLVAQSSTGRAGDQLTLDLDDKRAAVATYEKLKDQIFPDFRVGLIHGKLKPKEKEAVMAAFTEGKLDILVATAVIEVGIDIPNATVMMIEGAERFGLAQLHQFRGRVGRSEHQSYCLVFTDSSTSTVFDRLRAFANTISGFEIAELDLKLRGPGQLLGLEQSGLGKLKIASISDIATIQWVKQAAMTVMNDGLERYPILKARLAYDRRSQHLD